MVCPYEDGNELMVSIIRKEFTVSSISLSTGSNSVLFEDGNELMVSISGK
jgi:hypothetical protein